MQHDQDHSQSNIRDSLSIRRSTAHRKNQHLIDYLVKQVGIHENSAKILVYVHQCKTKAEALEILTVDSKDFYKHIFIPSEEGKEGTCDVCGGQQDKHIILDLGLIQDSLKEGSEEEKQFHGQQSSISFGFPSEQEKRQDENQVLCEVCYMKYKTNDIAHFNGTIHFICVSCMSAYIDQKITSMQIQAILCPHCGYKLTSDIIRNFCSEKRFKVYEQFLKNQEILKNPNLMWCPNPKCCVVISIAKKRKIFPCPKCQIKICSKCKREAHKGKSCNSFFQNQVKKWQNSESIQRCSKCFSIVEKISGCNHMSCSVCGHQWCWLCGANYSQRHYNPLNPFGCAGMQNRDGIGKCRIWVWRIFLFLVMLISFPIAFPLALLFSGPFVTIQALYKKVEYKNSCCQKICAVVLGFILGMVFNPIIWIGLTIYFSPKIIDLAKDYFRNRRRRLETAENRLNERLINDAIQNSEKIVFEGQHR